jgi:hypothetical protein
LVTVGLYELGVAEAANNDVQKTKFNKKLKIFNL